MRIEQIWRYPVKSVGGHRVAAATVTDTGIEGDRSWGIVDDATGNVLTGRREPRLLMATAILDDDGPVITVEKTRPMRTSEELSMWLGRSVTLTRAGAEGGTYENPLDFEHDDDWMGWQGPGGAWHDSAKARLSIVSRDTMGEWDPRRFRANLVVDGAGEDGLVDHRVKVGGVLVVVVKPITRCVMVTRPQPGLERDLDVLRTINRTRNSTLGVGAVVISGGWLAEGDELTPP
jgi:uncharacterized protein YcbX